MRTAALIPLLLISLAVPAFACLWDYDTLAMERQRFPAILELITGKFLRHTPEFYRWRIQDRLVKLQHDPENLAWLDDLGVAYEKTGRHDRAIETMSVKERIRPGLYETLANLGTFHLHAGRLATGVEFIAKAIEVNPQAHFGREIYQKMLVEYVMAHSPEGKPDLPLAREPHRYGRPGGFAAFVVGRPGGSKEELPAALQGVLGMMKFGTHDHPILLEALGDLLIGKEEEDAKRLAARAYLKASYAAPDPAVKAAYRAKAAGALSMQLVSNYDRAAVTLENLEADFTLELEDARAWYAGVATDERAWIQDGKDPEAEFARKYYQEPIVVDTSPWPRIAARAEADLRPAKPVAHGPRPSDSRGWVTVLMVLGALTAFGSAILASSMHRRMAGRRAAAFAVGPSERALMSRVRGEDTAGRNRAVRKPGGTGTRSAGRPGRSAEVGNVVKASRIWHTQ